MTQKEKANRRTRDRRHEWKQGYVFTDEGQEQVAWHSLSSKDVIERLKTDLNGLTPEECQKRLELFGPNELPTRKPPSVIEIFTRQFLSPLIYVLIAAAIVSLVLDEFLDALFIFIVVMINAVIGTIQEMKAEKSAERLHQLLKTSARVRRGGKELIISADNLVPGDVILLEAGNKVPADVRLLTATNFAVDESLLTGESLPVSKITETLPEDTVVSDRKNMAYAGTTVSSGIAAGIVVETGLRTEIGKIAEVVSFTESEKPPLMQRLERFSKQITYIILLASFLLASIAFIKGMPLDEVFFFAVALAVSAIPEGLPVAVTVALVVRIARMSNRNVLVRRLAAVESLGSCTCIASDKTGTLTVNRQTVRHIYLSTGSEFGVKGEGYSGDGEIVPSNKDTPMTNDVEHLRELAIAGALCNDASLVKSGEDWISSGDAVDLAFLAFAYKININPEELRKKYQLISEIPFESEKRFAAKLYIVDGKPRVYLKGAVEKVLQFCRYMKTKEGVSEIDHKHIERIAEDLAGRGYRVLAVAVGDVEPSSSNTTLSEENIPPLIFLGVAGLIDPPRSEVKKAVEVCKRAGIEVVMITGDHPSTALAIAKELGIAAQQDEVITGVQLTKYDLPSSKEFLEIVGKKRVFARVTPIQKLQIVEALIKIGHFVAVTGDGVNDAPALRKANIGVAMGSGTDVAKDASSIIITDDNFASIVAGVEEGRYAYENIRKVTYLLVSTGAAEIILFLLAVFIGLQADGVHLALPLVAIQILWLNVVTNGIQHVFLAMEAGDPGVMSKPPRKPSEGIFDKTMIRQVGVSSLTMGVMAFSLFYYLLEI
ncbi:MAG: HAD-IC family P-type ATPase, partial [Methanomassiliicoccales archaeon]